MDNLDFNFFCADCRQSEEYRRANCFTRYRVRRYQKGDIVAFSGQRVSELSIVVSGAINVSFVQPSGLIIRSVDHLAPTPIGAIALFSKKNRYLVDTRAIEECTVISIAKEDVISQMAACQDFMVSFIDFSASRVDALTSHIALLSQRSVAAKVAYYIFLCSRDGHSYKFPQTLRILSEHMCVERPSLSRVIASFVQQGLITYHRGSGEILDPKGLKCLVT
ncbi:MAG: Crp/Fnr family transcriptional regulator [Rikenellaceae bacterium]